jgi:glycosyltransferase involved in cell wall biosynthesis
MVPEANFVSVIMNCYNGEKYLREAIDSVLLQTYNNWELIFWDNQSSDRSAEIIKSYDDKRLKYFYAPKHTLLYEARNYAIEKASGEFFAFLDVDDKWTPEKLESQIPLFDNPNVGIVYGNYWLENERNKSSKINYNKQLPTGRIINKILRKYEVGLLTIIIRRRAFERLEVPFNARYHIIGDFDLVIRIALDWEINCFQEPVGYYRWHGDNESFRHNDIQVRELKHWHAEMSENPVLANLDGFKRSIFHLEYMKAVVCVDQNKYIDAIKVFYSLPICIEKFKLLFIIMVPDMLVKLLRT